MVLTLKSLMSIRIVVFHVPHDGLEAALFPFNDKTGKRAAAAPDGAFGSADARIGTSYSLQIDVRKHVFKVNQVNAPSFPQIQYTEKSLKLDSMRVWVHSKILGQEFSQI
jgi:hypothetical protein